MPSAFCPFAFRPAGFVMALWMGLVLACSATALAADRPRPNFVIVLVDDLRWDELGYAGHPYIQTPHVDRLAREGARFENAFCTTPLCSPSRASFLTGLYAQTHKVVDNVDRSAYSHTLDTFPRHLQAAGYETAFVGKWHMGVDATPRPGFDYWVGIEGQGTCFDPKINVNGEPRVASGYVTDIFNERAVDFVRRKRDKPFLLYLSHKAIHPEVQQFADSSISDPAARTFPPAPRHEKLYDGVTIPRRRNFNHPPRNKPALERQLPDVPPLSPATSSEDDVILGRQRMLAAIDEGVGQLLDALKAAGCLEDTMFVFTSDHGYFYGEHCLSVERRLAYEEAIRIPLAIRYPPIVAPGTLVDQMVLSIDLAPTVLELAGLAGAMPVEGRSFVPQLEGRRVADWRTSFLIEHSSDTVFPRMHQMGYQALRTERYTYIRYRELPGMDELYDLATDPYQLENLYSRPGMEGITKSLKQELDSLIK